MAILEPWVQKIFWSSYNFLQETRSVFTVNCMRCSSIQLLEGGRGFNVTTEKERM